MNIIQRQGQQRNMLTDLSDPIEDQAVELGKMASNLQAMLADGSEVTSGGNWNKYYSLKVNAGETIKAHVATYPEYGVIAKVSEDGTLISRLAASPSSAAAGDIVDVTYTATEDMWVAIYNRNNTLATPTVTVTSRGSDWNDSRYHK